MGKKKAWEKNGKRFKRKEEIHPVSVSYVHLNFLIKHLISLTKLILLFYELLVD